MKHLLNTLYVTTQGSYLRKEGETIVVEAEKQVRARLPIHNIGGLVCFGNVLCSPFLLGHCGENGVAVSFLSEYGRFLARVDGPQSGNVLLRREQYRRADDGGKSADLARMFVLGKLNNARTVLQRHLRDHPEAEGHSEIEALVQRLPPQMARLQGAPGLEGVRGIEGDAAHSYFGVFNRLLSDKTGFEFHERSRRPPLDPVNALLSFLYTMLAHDCRSACEGVGLDPQVGFLHRDRPGRPGLALDLMEEFRPLVVDSAVITALNTGRFGPDDFVVSTAGCAMKDKARKTLIQAYEQRLDHLLTHPVFEYRCSWRAVVRVQAKLLAKALRGEIAEYTGITTR